MPRKITEQAYKLAQIKEDCTILNVLYDPMAMYNLRPKEISIND
jgi:hypothetical protein